MSNEMTGICAIYSGFAQATVTRKTILSLTSTSFRNGSQIHVRRNSVFVSANQTPLLAPVFSSNRKVHALSSSINVKSFGNFLLTVSKVFLNQNHQNIIQGKISSNIKRKMEKIFIKNHTSLWNIETCWWNQICVFFSLIWNMYIKVFIIKRWCCCRTSALPSQTISHSMHDNVKLYISYKIRFIGKKFPLTQNHFDNHFFELAP